VPSLALLAFMVPVLAAMGLHGIGTLPALLGLFVYSLLPILRNTVTGLRGLDPAVLEAARGVGMTPWQSLLRVELPLSLPVVIAGIRTSATLTVGTATLATPVGATSLGSYIFGGLQTRNYAAVLVGCAASAVLALVLDGLIRVLALGLERRRRGLAAVGVAGLLGLAVIGATPALRGLLADDEPEIVVGAKTFTESYVLAHVLAGQVERQTGARVRTLESLGSTVAFDALARGEIDAYVDYSGTLWATVLARGEVRPDRAALLDEVARALEPRGVVVVGALGFENTYVLLMRREHAERLSVRSTSELAPHAPSLRLGSDYELFQRPEWATLRATYGLGFAEQRSMDPSLLYDAVAAGEVDVIAGFSTDGRIGALDLVALEDDRGAIPPYDAVILAGAGLRRERPDVVLALAGLAGRIDATTMRELNRRVDQEGQSPAAVAASFLDGAP
jgi:osmoprotectant transport system permease protein